MGAELRARQVVWVGVVVCLVPWAGARAGWAVAEQRDAFTVDPWVSVPLIVGGLVAAGSMDLVVKPTLPKAHCAPLEASANPRGWRCDPGPLNRWDQLVLDNDSPGAKTASDVLVVTTMLAPAVGGLIDALRHRGEGGWGRYGEDMLIVGETLAVNYLLNNIVKYGVRRARPLIYNPNYSAPDAYDDPDAALSFYSLHSSFAFAAATSYSYLFTQRHPGDYAQVVPVWLLTHGLAATTAALRVEAGKHFWTDVVVGAVVGASLGVLVPYLHKREDGAASGEGAPQGQTLQVGLGSMSMTW
jgi:membrane-associated phospholipid phosphatase